MSFFSGCRYIEILRFSMSAIIYYQNPCKLLISFRCIKAFMHAFSGRFSKASLEGTSFKFFVCSIFNVIPVQVQDASLLQIYCNVIISIKGIFPKQGGSIGLGTIPKKSIFLTASLNGIIILVVIFLMYSQLVKQ